MKLNDSSVYDIKRIGSSGKDIEYVSANIIECIENKTADYTELY